MTSWFLPTCKKALNVFAERTERVFVVRGRHAVYDDIRVEVEHFDVEAHDVFVQHLLCDVKIADEPPGKILDPLVFLCVFLQKKVLLRCRFSMRAVVTSPGTVMGIKPYLDGNA